MNTSAQTAQQKSIDPTLKAPPKSAVGGSMAKEQLGGSVQPKETISAAMPEVQPAKEVLDAGLSVQTDTVDVAPDLKNIGVLQSGPGTPVAVSLSPAVVLPLSDEAVVLGLHMRVYSAFRWLAEWCVRKLKKAHMTIRVIHGKVMRVPYKPYE